MVLFLISCDILLFGEDEPFGCNFLCGGSAFHDVFDFLVNVFEGVEDGKRDAFLLAVGDQIMTVLCEQQIRFPCSREIRDAISAVEQCWALSLGLRIVWPDCQGLVVAEMTVIMVGNLPTFIRKLNLIGNNLNFLCLRPHKVRQKGTDNRLHSRGENNNGDSFRQAPIEKGLEPRVELDILAKKLDAFWEWELDGVKHVLECISEAPSAVEDFEVELSTAFQAVSDIVSHVIITVFQSNCSIKVREDNSFGFPGPWSIGIPFGRHLVVFLLDMGIMRADVCDCGKTV